MTWHAPRRPYGEHRDSALEIAGRKAGNGLAVALEPGHWGQVGRWRITPDQYGWDAGRVAAAQQPGKEQGGQSQKDCQRQQYEYPPVAPHPAMPRPLATLSCLRGRAREEGERRRCGLSRALR